MHAHERRDGRVNPGQLQRDHSVEQAGATWAAIALAGKARDAEFGDGRDQVVRELFPGPVVVDDRSDRLLHELPDAPDCRQPVRIEQLLERVEVGGQRGIHVVSFTGYLMRG